MSKTAHLSLNMTYKVFLEIGSQSVTPAHTGTPFKVQVRELPPPESTGFQTLNIRSELVVFLPVEA